MGRVAISLSADERAELRALATRRGEPEATAAARLVRAGLVDGGACLDQPPARRRGPQTPTEEPARPDRQRSIRLLLERYPQELSAIRDPDRLVVERLSALGLWREQLDAETAPDVRGELAFCNELVTVARWLEERGRRRR